MGQLEGLLELLVSLDPNAHLEHIRSLLQHCRNNQLPEPVGVERV